MLKNTLLITLLALSGTAVADSFWNHNGSLMRLSADGNERVFTYEVPSKTMLKTGVTKGTVLFEGQRNGNRYSGEARVFSKDCDEPLVYRVAGNTVGEKKVVMKGKREKYTSGCRATGKMVTDTLVFTYQYSE